MIVSDIELYEILSSKLGKEQAKALTEYVEQKVEKQLNEKTTVFATKADIANLRAEMKQDKVDIIKWLVGTAIAIIGLLSGITFAMLNVYLRH